MAKTGVSDEARHAFADSLMERSLECGHQANERRAAGRPESEVAESKLKARWFKKLARDVRRGKV